VHRNICKRDPGEQRIRKIQYLISHTTRLFRRKFDVVRYNCDVILFTCVFDREHFLYLRVFCTIFTQFHSSRDPNRSMQSENQFL